MPARYSGNVAVRITYHDPTMGSSNRNGTYACKVTWPGGRSSVTVGAPAFLSDAVDSPIAYDDTAHAALAFVSADEDNLATAVGGDFAPAYSDNGFAIRRKR